VKSTQQTGSGRSAAALSLTAVGVVSILGQVVILRELSVAFYGIELIYILAMGIWLFWTACGAVIGKKTFLPSPVAIGYVFICVSFLLPADVAFIRGIRILFDSVPGAYLSFEKQMLSLLLSLCPVGLLLGLGFQWSAKLYIGMSGTLPRAYGIESLGGLIGGLTATLLMTWGMQNFRIALLCSGLSASLPVFPLFSRKNRRLKHVGIIGVGLWLACQGLAPAMDRAMTRWNHSNLVVSRDSPYSRITITEREGQFVVFENDALGFETQGTASEEFVHLSALQCESPRNVLISGGGVEGIIREVLKHHPTRIDYIELNPVLMRLAIDYLPAPHAEDLKSQAVSITVADPRAFLSRAGTYDMILTAMPEPFSGQSNRFYTREYFRMCAEKLNPDGIFAFRLPSSENIWTAFLSYRNAGIFKALTAVFHDALFLPGTTNTVLASNATLVRDPKRLNERFFFRHIEAQSITPAYISYLYTNDRFFSIQQRLVSTEAPENSDTRPLCYQYSCLIWISKFFSTLINPQVSFYRRVEQAESVLLPAAVLMLCGAAFLFRNRPAWKRVLLAALAGFMGMMLETMLLLHYQSVNGVLFQNIGLLLMVFMAGLATGSVQVAEIAVRCENRGGLAAKKIGQMLLLGFGLLPLAFLFSMKTANGSILLTTAGFLFASGFFVGGVFSYAARLGVDNQRGIVSPVYAADLLGGCFGSLLGSLVMIPFLGMEHTAVWMTVLSLIGLLMV